MTAPVVSVVIPAFDAERTLGAQLEALAAQTGAPAFEVIVSDNGSTDRTAAQAHRFADAVPSLIVVDSSSRRGPSAARNQGAARARGRLLAFCDADDVVHPRWLAALCAGLAHADAVAGAFEHSLLNPRGAAAVSWSTDVPIRLDTWPALAAGASSNLGITAAAFAELGGFDEDLVTCEDIDLCWRVQLAGMTLAFSGDAIVHERKRTGVRATYRQSVSYARGRRALEDKHRRLLGSEVPGAVMPESGTREPTDADAAVNASHVRWRSWARRAGKGDVGGLGADLAWRLGQRAGARVIDAGR